MDRSQKGNSLIAFPDQYVCVDTETTGLSCAYDHVIEVSAVRFSAGAPVDKFTTLVNPGVRIPAYITALTGITNEMVQDAPGPESVFPGFFRFVGDDIIVGHNVNFDINFLYDSLLSCGLVLSNDFVDTMRISRKLYPDEKHHRLSDLVARLDVEHDGAHRAESDAFATALCYERMKAMISESVGFEAFASSFNKASGRYDPLRGILPPTGEVDETNPIYGRTVVFTGALSSMSRRDALQIVSNLGGIPANGVTKNTNILVVGSEEFAASVKNGKTNKMKKAEDLELNGYDIVTLSEDTFLDMIT